MIDILIHRLLTIAAGPDAGGRQINYGKKLTMLT